MTESRKTAMRNIWILLVWLSIVAFEAQLYSVLGYILFGQYCQMTNVSVGVNAFINYIDRFLNY